MSLMKDKNSLVVNKREYSDTALNKKQYGFFFDAQKCLMCHSCEAVCGSKNKLPSHIAFRKVGFVEGGSYPDFRRINISMACNHCEDPVCLKGCPTRAYTKYEEFGAVIQDPETCFGCQYCTWVCPYNAPAFDKEKGVVSKCNFCIDKLADGERPACVEACVGGALEFYILAEITDQYPEKQIPGLPAPEITNPSIRFEQSKTVPDFLNRGDGEKIGYQKDAAGNFRAIQKGEEEVKPSIRTEEDPLLFFTLIAQMVIGSVSSFLMLDLLNYEITDAFSRGLLSFTLSLLAVAMAVSVLHLGRAQFFYRSANNLRYSWVGREIVSVGAVFSLLAVLTVNSWFVFLPEPVIVLCRMLFPFAGAAGIFCMSQIYQIKARPFWKHKNTFVSFFSATLTTGPLLAGVFYMFSSDGSNVEQVLKLLCLPALTGSLLQISGNLSHLKYLESNSAESNLSLSRIMKNFQFEHGLRLGGLGSIAVLSGLSFVTGSIFLFGVAFFLSLLTQYLDRALFYTLVAPASMPGAFFWRNRSFEHAEKHLTKLATTGGAAKNAN